MPVRQRCGERIGTGVALVVAYGFESVGSNVIDVTGNGNSAVLEAGAARVEMGSLGRGILLDGVSGRVNMGIYDPPVVDGFSTSMSIRPDDLDIFDARLISKATGVTDADHCFMVSTFGTELRFRLMTTSGGTTTLISSGANPCVSIVTGVGEAVDRSPSRVYRNRSSCVNSRSVRSSAVISLAKRACAGGDR